MRMRKSLLENQGKKLWKKVNLYLLHFHQEKAVFSLCRDVAETCSLATQNCSKVCELNDFPIKLVRKDLRGVCGGGREHFF